MNEAFLHYIWQNRLFDISDLITDDGQRIEIESPGQYNTGAGPDFFNARLRIDGTLWAGNVEIHINSSDWQKHHHHYDPVYDNCILHVVYKNDSTTTRMNGSRIPAIELMNRFPPYLWDNYLRLIGTYGWVPCQHRISEVDAETWRITIEDMIHERLEHRTQQIFVALKGTKDDWEECFYQHLSRNFGFQLNAIPFEMLSRSLPLKIIRKEFDKPLHLESLIFGQAGMLESEPKDDHPKQLYDTYQHLSKKYSLKNIPFSSWKFLRLRPVNFPAIRLAQFSALLARSPVLFHILIESGSLNNLLTIFDVQASDYWNTHYHFDKISSYKIKKLGTASVNNVFINTCIPFLFAWGKYTGNENLKERALSFLNDLPSEENNLISRWKDIGIKAHSAVESQALLQLKILYCDEKKCLTCNIGNKLINILP